MKRVGAACLCLASALVARAGPVAHFEKTRGEPIGAPLNLLHQVQQCRETYPRLNEFCGFMVGKLGGKLMSLWGENELHLGKVNETSKGVAKKKLGRAKVYV